MNSYTLIIRTGESEIRAVENSSHDVLNSVFPIIEITRGRKITNKISKEVTYPFITRLERLKKVFKGKSVGLALTNEQLLSSAEINFLNNSEEGYANWINFLLKIKSEHVFFKIVPVIAVDFTDEYFEFNLKKQLEFLQNHFDEIIYRSDINDENSYDDLSIIREVLNEQTTLNVIIDCSYTPQASFVNVVKSVSQRVINFKDLLKENKSLIKYIVASTSFPNNVSDMGGGDSDIYIISSVDMHNALLNEVSGVTYGDYGSINPIRNDQVVMARGWIPRIDVPLIDTVFYYRLRRPKGITTYSSTYTRVANLVIEDKGFPKELVNNWGIQQIINCASGMSPGSSPSFWISVRMNIHIEQQVRRLLGR